ncbi:MAG: hypothetical protein IJS19_00535 [Muribaculaceae bacterium]|nr:hypothetical protein [Muribaculaceae bacterium]
MPSYTITGPDARCFSASKSDTGAYSGVFSTNVKETITYTPDGLKGSHTAKLRISSPNANDVFVTLNGVDNGYSETGVDAVESLASEISTVYYTMQGVRVANPEKGQILVRVATLSDGSLRTTKLIVK